MEPKLQHQQQVVAAILADGRWHGVEDFMRAHIPDYRKRLSELRELFPGRYDSRYRTRHPRRTKPYTAKDWVDLETVAALHNHVANQINAMRASGDGHAGDTAGMVRLPDGAAVKGVTWAQLRTTTTQALTEQVLAGYLDPWGPR